MHQLIYLFTIAHSKIHIHTPFTLVFRWLLVMHIERRWCFFWSFLVMSPQFVKMQWNGTYARSVASVSTFGPLLHTICTKKRRFLSVHTIGRSKGGHQGRPRGPNSFIFMQFSAKIWEIIAILWVGAPPWGTSWIRHCTLRDVHRHY